MRPEITTDNLEMLLIRATTLQKLVSKRFPNTEKQQLIEDLSQQYFGNNREYLGALLAMEFSHLRKTIEQGRDLSALTPRDLDPHEIINFTAFDLLCASLPALDEHE